MRPLLEREREPPPPHSAAPISIYTWSSASCVVVVYDLVSPSLTIRSAHPFVYSTITIIDRYDVHYTESIILVGIIDSWKFRRRYPALLDTSPTPYDISFGCLNIGEFHNAISAANNNNRLAQQLKFDEYIRFKRTRREREREESTICYIRHVSSSFSTSEINRSSWVFEREREREKRAGEERDYSGISRGSKLSKLRNLFVKRIKRYREICRNTGIYNCQRADFGGVRT